MRNVKKQTTYNNKQKVHIKHYSCTVMNSRLIYLKYNLQSMIWQTLEQCFIILCNYVCYYVWFTFYWLLVPGCVSQLSLSTVSHTEWIPNMSIPYLSYYRTVHKSNEYTKIH